MSSSEPASGTAPLLRLSRQQREALEILFVAPHAPDPGASPPDLHAVFGVAPRYNHELFTLLGGLGLRVTPCRDLDRFAAEVSRHNYVFTIFNRAPFRNSELLVSTICEWRGIPYLGAPPNIRALAEDKHLTKLVAQALGIPTAPWAFYEDGTPRDAPPPWVPPPYFVKPRFCAASEEIGADSIQGDWEGARQQIGVLLMRGKPCLVESCVPGSDVTVPVLGGDPPLLLPPAEEVSELPAGIATYRQKRLLDGGRQRRRLPEGPAATAIAGYVRRLCAAAVPFDYLRADFRLHRDTGAPYLLEFNICCNLGSHAAIVFAAREAGLTHAAVVEHILCASLNRQRRPPAPATAPVPPTDAAQGVTPPP